MPFTVHANKVAVLKKIATSRTLIQKLRMRWMKFVGHIMRKGDLENLIISGRIFGRRGRRKLRVNYLISLHVWREDCRNTKESDVTSSYNRKEVVDSHNNVLKRMSHK